MHAMLTMLVPEPSNSPSTKKDAAARMCAATLPSCSTTCAWVMMLGTVIVMKGAIGGLSTRRMSTIAKPCPATTGRAARTA